MTEEEIIRLRGYLATQSMRRTPEQILEALQEAYQQFIQAIAGVPNIMSPHEHAWSVLEIVEHVSLFLSQYQAAICGVLEKGERPSDVHDRQAIIPQGDKTNTKERLLLAFATIFEHLTFAVLHADPSASLDRTWRHFELGEMHWREWLLFSRVHLLDHVRQVQQMHVLVE